jgi:2-aminoethylphosphonate-pyruvate transaminase
MLFTMAVQVAFACDEALAELEEETVSGRVARYRRAAEHLRRHFGELGLRCLVPEGSRSNSLTTLELPPGLAYPRLHDELKRRGFIIYEGQAALQNEIFRVANMGHLTLEDFDAFVAALGQILTAAGAEAAGASRSAGRA